LQIQYGLFKKHKIFLYYRSTYKDGAFFAIKEFIPSNWKIVNLSTVNQIILDKTPINISANNFCLSGYGDRMMDLFNFAILANVYNAIISIKWVPFVDTTYKDYPSWRFQDTHISAITQFIKFPSYIELCETDTNHQYHANTYMGGTTSPEILYNEFKDIITFDNFLKTIEEIKSDFKLHVENYVHPRPFITVHLRRTDKLRGRDGFQINISELSDLDIKTIIAIQGAKEKGYTDFYLASDSEETKKMYTENLNLMGLNVINPPNIHNLLESYYDTWLMCSSSLIIVSMKFSAFSLFPGLYFNIPIYNVYKNDAYTKYNSYIKIINDLSQIDPA
jgi:hypothetical protein